MDPVLSQDTLDEFRDSLLARYPIHSVNLEVHETGVTLNDPGDFPLSDAYPALNQLRMMESIPEEVFLYGLLPGSGEETLCISWIGTRLAVGYEDVPTLGETTALCMGFSMGLTGVQCPEGGNPPFDPTYPYPDGLIGTWGYNIMTGERLDPTTHYSTQSQCFPRWYSDHEWMQFPQYLWE